MAPLGRGPHIAVTVGLAGALIFSAVTARRALAADALFLRARTAAREGGDRFSPLTAALRLNPIPERYQIELIAAQRAHGTE